jgi:hypothetical protein
MSPPAFRRTLDTGEVNPPLSESPCENVQIHAISKRMVLSLDVTDSCRRLLGGTLI